MAVPDDQVRGSAACRLQERYCSPYRATRVLRDVRYGHRLCSTVRYWHRMRYAMSGTGLGCARQ
eukprot:994071-Rhodomonas_salina.2